MGEGPPDGTGVGAPRIIQETLERAAHLSVHRDSTLVPFTSLAERTMLLLEQHLGEG